MKIIKLFIPLIIGTLIYSCGSSPVTQPTTSNRDYKDSPFGFLNSYIYNDITRPSYSSYGSFSAVQGFYRDLNVHWDRGSGEKGGAVWGVIEPNPPLNGLPSYTWGSLDEYINTAKKNNINLLITINPGCLWGGSRYGLPADMDSYAELVRTTSDAIREGSPDCRILLGSSINVDENGNPKSIVPYFEPVLRELNKDGKKYFDIFDYHFFPPKGYTPESYYRALGEGIASVRNLLDKYGYSNADIWITETMIFTTDGMSEGEIQKLPEEYRVITEKQHAQALIKTYVLALSKGVKKIFWNKLTEGPWFDFMFNRCGLIRHPVISGSTGKKLAYYSYKLMVEKLEGSDWDNIQTIQESDGIYVNKFTKNGKSVWVAWNDNSQKKQITISGLIKDQVKITEAVADAESGAGLNENDYPDFFNTETKSINNGKVAITLTESPVFVEEK